MRSPQTPLDQPSSEPPVAVRHSSTPPAVTEELLRVVVAHAPIMLWAIDRDGTFTLVEGSGRNAAEPQMAGMAVGLSAFEFYAGVRLTVTMGASPPGQESAAT